jgi:hypothetical protein
MSSEVIMAAVLKIFSAIVGIVLPFQQDAPRTREEMRIQYGQHPVFDQEAQVAQLGIDYEERLWRNMAIANIIAGF